MHQAVTAESTLLFRLRKPYLGGTIVFVFVFVGLDTLNDCILFGFP